MRSDVSGWLTRLDDEAIAKYAKSGKWTGVTLLDCARRCAEQHPNRIAFVDGAHEYSFASILEQAYRLANALHRRGLKAGDVVSFQLPNWHETAVINLACSIGGYICNPIIPIYRDAEVGFMLGQARTRVLFIPRVFRSFDYMEMIERLRKGLPELGHVALVRASQAGHDSLQDWIDAETGPVEDFPVIDANAVKLLLYTSGTTGEPKGVLHSHNTLRADIDATIQFLSLDQNDVMLMPSPVTHITGYLYALELPFALGATVVLMERWLAAEGVDLAERHEATFSVGATPFLIELVAEVERRGRPLDSMRLYGCGGAPVPPEIILRANSALPHCLSFRAYGCSEAPTITLGIRKGDPVELGASTDGCVLNHEVRIVDASTGEPVKDGEDGEILTRGPEVMLGYTRPEYTSEAFDDEGYFRTGDIGRLDARGYITITGRKKDLIIRGGENLSPKEIEDALHRHPSVHEAAVVAMPHSRMGETPCAYVTLRPGVTFDFDAMKSFLEEIKLARQKIPEKLVIVDELPHNAAGKVLKHILRAQCARDVA